VAKCLGCGAAVNGRGEGSEWRGSYALCSDCIQKGAEIKRLSELKVRSKSPAVCWRPTPSTLWRAAAERAKEQRAARLARRPVQGSLL
jgi:hypothetical protein